MRDVEADHRHVDPAREHALGGLRVGPDVELGRGRAVALADRAAHEHDPLRARVGMEREQERHVGQRPDGDEREAAPAGAHLTREELDGVLGDRRGRRVGELGAVQAGLAVDVRGDVALAHERPVGAGRDGHVGAAGELEHAERVRRRLLERLVARDGRDPDQLDLGRGEREQDRDRVVVAGVAVEDDRRAHRAEYPVHLRRGRQRRLRAAAARPRARPPHKRGGAPRRADALRGATRSGTR